MNRKIVCMLMLWLAALSFPNAQTRHITVEGCVTDRQGDPIPGVIIRITGDKSGGATGESGLFKMEMEPDAEITFSCVGFNPLKIKLRGRTRLDIVLRASETQLPEVMVVSSVPKKNNKIEFAPSDLELVRNKLYLRTRYRIPKDRFHKDSRLIIHPFLVNHTTGERKAFTPAVYDGKNYVILMERGSSCGDPEERIFYSPFATVPEHPEKLGLIAYSDSCTIEDAEDQYTTEVRVKISTYCDDEYRDTLTIAHGVKYPMRFFDYRFAARDLDDRYAPKQTPVSFHEKGEIHLRFRADDSRIYENEGNNGKELRRLMKELEYIDKNPTKTLQVFQIVTYNSPEGTYEYNLKLAQKRTRNAAGKILSALSPETLRKAKITHNGVIEPWSAVCDRMTADARPEAAQLGSLIKRARNIHNEISWGARRLKCYSLINEFYLAPLRRVEYSYEYSELRTLNKQELESLYRKSPENLTASEYWSYIGQQPELTDSEKEQLLRQALKIHPDLMIAANNLAASLIRQERTDTTLLKPFLKENAPEEIWLNQTVALLQVCDFDRADQLATRLPHHGDSRIVKALVAAMNGRYEEAYSVLAPQGGINQVVLLLSMKRNSEAWDVLSQFEDPSAEIFYLKAIAANRLNRIGEAFTYLEAAIDLKPELKEIARKDGDVLDLLQEENNQDERR